MAESRKPLSLEDVERLASQPSAENKIDIASRLLADAPQITLNPEESAIAEEIIRRLAGDAEQAVREALAWQVANSPLLADDVAKKLAGDVASVAFPILRYSDLPEDSLLTALGSEEPRKAIAVAGRKQLSPAVANELVDTGNIKAISVLMGNQSVCLSESVMTHVLDRYGLIKSLSNSMARREELTAEVVDRLLGLVSQNIRNFLASTYDIPADRVSELVHRSREAAMVHMLEPIGGRTDQLEPFLRRLHENKQLSPTFLFRALCAGEILMFRLGLSIRGSLPLLAIDELLRDRGPLGLPALLRRCDISMTLLPAFKAGLHSWRESEFKGDDDQTRAFYQAEIIGSVFDDCLPLDDPDLELLLHELMNNRNKYD